MVMVLSPLSSFNPDSEKTPLKVVPSLAQILLKNGDFTEEALGSTFKNRL